MLLAIRTKNSPRPCLRFFIQLIAVCALGSQVQPAQSAPAIQEGLRLELPDNGNLRVENLRGGVIVEVWNEKYVSITAISDKGEVSRSPAVVQRTDALLSIRIARAVAAEPVNLQLKVPATAH